MRSILFLFIICLFSCAVSAQELPQEEIVKPQTDYLKRAKTQRTAGWILTSAGAAGLLLTLVADAAQSVGGGFTTVISLGTVEPEYKSYTTSYLLSAAGLAGGITLLAAAPRNFRKAKSGATVTLQMDKAYLTQNRSLNNPTYPAIAVTLKL